MNKSKQKVILIIIFPFSLFFTFSVAFSVQAAFWYPLGDGMKGDPFDGGIYLPASGEPPPESYSCSFTASPTSGNPPLTVNFALTYTGTSGCGETSVGWNAPCNPTTGCNYTYNDSGLYGPYTGQVQFFVEADTPEGAPRCVPGPYRTCNSPTINVGGQPPADPPTGMAGSALNETTIRWVWDDNSATETEYRVYDSAHNLLQILSANSTTWDEGGKSPGISYSRYVKACNAAGCSSASNTASRATSLNAPTGLSGVQASETSITWSWTDNSSQETGYRVYDASTSAQVGSDLPADTQTWPETSGLSTGGSYSRFVRAFTVATTSPVSNIATRALTLNAPTNFAGSGVGGNPNALLWSWTDNSGQETEYRIYECTSHIQKVTAAANATSVQEGSLSPSTSYCRYAKAYKGVSPVTESTASNEAWATTGSQYLSQGELLSAVLDTQVLGGAVLNSIMWQGSLPSGTAVKFQIASGNSLSGPWNYLGPSGTTSTLDIYQPSGPNVPVTVERKYHTGHRYFRYKALLYSDAEGLATPTIKDIILNWSP